MKSGVTENIRITFDHRAKLFKSFMLRVGQPGTIFPGLIHDKHPSAVQAEQRTDNHGPQYVMQIQNHVEIIFYQGRGKTKQSRQRFLRALRIDTDHVPVLRAVDKDRDQERLRQHGKRVRRIRLGCGIDNGNGHRHIPDSRKSYY